MMSVMEKMLFVSLMAQMWMVLALEWRNLMEEEKTAEEAILVAAVDPVKGALVAVAGVTGLAIVPI